MCVDDYTNDETTTGVLVIDSITAARFNNCDYEEYFLDLDWFRIDLVTGKSYKFVGTTTVYMELDSFGVRHATPHDSGVERGCHCR